MYSWLLSGLLLAGLVQAAPQPAFWKVTSNTGTAYLLGSFHVGRESFYPLPAPVEQAFAESAALVVELDLLAVDLYTTSRLAAEKGFYTEGSGLAGQIAPDLWQALVVAATERGLPEFMLRMQKPWLVAVTLSVQEFKQLGYEEKFGVDRHFLQRAHAQDSKPVIELESLTQQLDLMNELPLAAQEALLRQTLNELDQGPDYIMAMVTAWEQGDTVALDQQINASLANHALLQERLLIERNRNMATRLADLLAAGGTYFVVVGAGHLVGAGNVVTLLEQRGLHVERVTLAP